MYPIGKSYVLRMQRRGGWLWANLPHFSVRHPVGRRQFWTVRRLALIAAIVTFSIVMLPVGPAIAYPDSGAPPGVGSLDDYTRQGQPSERQYRQPGSQIGQGSQGYYGAPRGSRSQMNSAVMGAMILALWALQRYQERHQRHATRNYRGSGRRVLKSGNPMPAPLGF